ncbi:MAG TPA: MBL fold metallo-hydrolase [Deltaproteobacteria bacterium]|nr:MBL fold metallo-hydrolase [Deltaproteobacteria bacterium]
MNGRHFTAAALAGALFFLAAIGTAAAQPRLERLADGVYGFVARGGRTNSAFIVTGEGVVVVDTQGPRELALLLGEEIARTTDEPVIYVINTHYHGDHTFGNQYFVQAREIIAHTDTRRLLIERDEAHRRRFVRFFGAESLEGFELTLPTMTMDSELVLRPGGREIVVRAAPGAHTDGDIYVYLPEEKVVIAGDLLYSRRLPWLGDGHTGRWLEVLEELEALDADVYLPGHGEPTGVDGVRSFAAYLRELRAEVSRLMDEGKTLEEVKASIELPRYAGYEKYEQWLPLNAAKVYGELKEQRRGRTGK